MSVPVQTRVSAPRRRVLSRLSILLLGLVAAVLAVTSCQTNWSTGRSPISPYNRPTTIAGVTNGNLPAADLYTLNSTCRVYKQAAGSLNAMINAARADGVYLSTAECYRDYAGQVYWRKYWCARGICANAATPGYSNHGWGKAADLRDQYGSLTWSSPGYKWMVAHAGEYGWNHPGGVNEAWHWEWVGDGGTQKGYAVRVDLMWWAK